ncbi:hypothetical protein [Streptacidiphilus sp. P02-A3a]|uniref:hypothetical protein n=1 Tax=Streptacidiphilus sp. P02-A3a TaxID=2704468 RepID=UPI0015FA985B|nr:hypothetical protein [Streptacidiphilus sp. P02-A3a]QMU68474.1 hypothetical protein GXP74_09760 [Streptacidiphilus sp. P02-A3a]
MQPQFSDIINRSLLTGALRRAESVLLSGGQRTARRNAWDAVCENRRHALDRQESERILVRTAP